MPIDYKKYPKNWLSEIRPRILKRAENKCEVCGLEHRQTAYAVKFYCKDNNGRYRWRSVWFRNEQDAKRESLTGIYKKVKIIITIAHLDHDELNHNVTDDRLMAMCQICHLRYDAKEKMQRKLLKK